MTIDKQCKGCNLFHEFENEQLKKVGYIDDNKHI